MAQRIRRDIDRLLEELIDFFAEQTAAAVHEAMGQTGAMDAEVEPVEKYPTLCGPAITARVHRETIR